MTTTISPEAQRALDILRSGNGKLPRFTVMTGGMSKWEASRAIKELQDAGLLRVTGKNRGQRYEVIQENKPTKTSPTASSSPRSTRWGTTRLRGATPPIDAARTQMREDLMRFALGSDSPATIEAMLRTAPPSVMIAALRELGAACLQARQGQGEALDRLQAEVSLQEGLAEELAAVYRENAELERVIVNLTRTFYSSS